MKMLVEYEYIYFLKDVVRGEGKKTSVWDCHNKRSDYVLGVVKWYGPWRQYCFFPQAETIFNVGCMQDVCEFIDKLMNERMQVKR